MNDLEDRMRRVIRNSRRSGPFRIAARMAERYLNAWHNTGFYDFEQNGEAFVLKALARTIAGRRIVLWDVGAHGGEYAFAAHGILPAAKIVSFEILPPIAEGLKTRNFGSDWFDLKVLGLSDQSGSVDVAWNHQFDTTNSIHPRPDKWFNHGDVETVTCQVSTVDALVDAGEPAPDVLKIDVEGHEAAVLDGAQGLLSSPRAPMLIQFEYGETWIPASRTLFAVQTRLEALGYAVGRLYPDHVDFKPYLLSDERFRMGNMIATRDQALRHALS